METLFLWCHLNGPTVKAGAPTGIAAARLRVPRTPVCATTLRYLFALSVDGESKLDPTNAEDEGTKQLASMTVLMLDEGYMIDAPFWRCVRDQLSSVGAISAARASDRHPQEDAFGRVHIIVALDLKQLPPATSQPHFFAGDPEVFDVFDFRVLRQNRRIAVSGQDLDAFHGVLEDVAHGQASRRVRRALIGAYVRGAFNNQDTVKFDNSTACVSTGRIRDRWDGQVLKRIGKRYKRSLRIKAVFLARGSQSRWIRDNAARDIRRTVRLQSLPTLRLAGQWLEDPPLLGEPRPHCMRVMLVANSDVEHGHANGATGRLVSWTPEVSLDGAPIRSVRASDPDVQALFYHEASYQSSKQYFLPNIDFIDVEPKKASRPCCSCPSNLHTARPSTRFRLSRSGTTSTDAWRASLRWVRSTCSGAG